jgi:hypothetical protein
MIGSYFLYLMVLISGAFALAVLAALTEVLIEEAGKWLRSRAR